MMGGAQQQQSSDTGKEETYSNVSLHLNRSLNSSAKLPVSVHQRLGLPMDDEVSFYFSPLGDPTDASHKI